LKSELDISRSNLEFFDKTLKKAGNLNMKNLNSNDFAQSMVQKETEVNIYKGLIHNAIIQMKDIFDTSNDDFVLAFNDKINSYANNNKTLDEKFNATFDKFIKYNEVNRKITV
jgi:hypothetical protein